MDSTAPLSVDEFIEERAFSPFQYWLVAQCTVLCMIDGFDVQSIAFVAPVIAQQWNIAPASFGGVFGAGLAGLMIGALIGGPCADRFGRRPVLLVSILVFAVLTLATAFAQSITSLALLRFGTGLGLGGTLPNIIALTSEYSPKRIRATVVAVTFCGFPLGATIGGLISVVLVSKFGWQSVFYLGGLLPLALLVWLLRSLPESLRFMVARGRSKQEIVRILRKIEPSEQVVERTSYSVAAQTPAASGSAVLRLLTDGQARATLLLWTAFFSNLLAMYFLINWLPTLFQRAGLSIQRAILASVIMNAGAIAGGIAIGRAIDALGARRVLVGVSLLGSGFIAMTALVGTNVVLLAAFVFFVGACVVGAQMGMYTLAADTYPTSMRSTGIGWAMGMGRIGSIVGPIVGGLLIAADVPLGQMLLTCAAAPLIAAIALALLPDR